MNPAHTVQFPTEQERSQMPADVRQLWQNKMLVYDFFTRVINDHDLTAADRYLTEGYIQHNPGVPTGREGFKTYFASMFQRFPQTTVHILKILAEGDEVVIYCEHRMANRLTTLRMKTIDIWRIEDDLIAEHWDAVEGYGLTDRIVLSFQPQPNKSNSWFAINA